ncbi:hypothetical protein ACHAW6_000733 [Cyclotella cf. meneghiniana]
MAVVLCVEYESYVHSHTAHDIFQLNGNVPNMVALVLGTYLGPSIDVVPEMMQHSMKANGKYEDRSTLHQLTANEHMVLHQKHDLNGVPVGTAHKQPAMDTHVYEVRFQDGCTKELAVNTIAEAFYAQCEPDGNQYIMLDAIMDCRKNSDVAISWNDQVKIVDGKKVVSCSTRGWELCCEWKNGSTSWQKLSDLKESHPLQVAEFVLAVGIANEPGFNW